MGAAAAGFRVAQICNLLFRRIASCWASAVRGALRISDALPIANRRYSRLQVCATLKPGSPSPDAGTDLIGSWRWLAPVLGCLLVLAGVFNPRDREGANLTAANTNNLLAVLATQRTYAAYVTAGFHSRQNAVGADTFEWTNGQGLPSSVAPFSAHNTNSLR
jgi:hypothetical protein